MTGQNKFFSLSFHSSLRALLLLFLFCSGCTQPSKHQNGNTKKEGVQAEQPTFKFVNRTPESGVQGTYRNGRESGLRTMLETLGGGVGIVDFDLDGQFDCFFNGGGTFPGQQQIAGLPSFLYRNLENWKFSLCSQESGIDTSKLYNHGCQFGDLDNDGFADLVVTGYRGILVFRNLGDGSLEPVECGIQTDKWATSAALADFDQDGNLDLFVCNYLEWSFTNHRKCTGPDQNYDVCSPRAFKGTVDDLFTSQGDWTFTRDGEKKGILSNGKSLGVVTGDIDIDGDVDIYVACDVSNNLLYLNQGNGTFLETGARLGVDIGDESMPNGSMGTDISDFNNDGLPDIGVANFESEDFALYKQVRIGGKESAAFIFNLVSKKTKLTAMDQMYVGWGTIFEDFDSDGDEDLIVNNGHISYFPDSGKMQQKPLIFENAGNTFRFKGIVQSDYFDQRHHGRGCAVADLDLDGDLDLVFSNCNENFAILENVGPQKQSMKRISLIGSTLNRDCQGICVRNGNQQALKMKKGGGSFLSSLMPDIWGNTSTDQLTGEPIPTIPRDLTFSFLENQNHIIGIEIAKNGEKR